MRERPRFQKNGALSHDLKAEVDRYLATTSTGRYTTAGQLVRGLCSIVGLIAAYTMLLATPLGPMSLVWAVLISIFGFGFLATLCHDAAHGSVVRSRKANRWILTFGFAVFGVSGALWGWRHTALHHVYPNVAGTDIDGEGSALVRLGAHRPLRPWHRFQAFYAPFLYTLIVAHLAWVEDFENRKMGVALAPSKFQTRSAMLEFVGVKLFHAAVFILVPWLVLKPTLPEMLLGYWLATGTASLLFVIMAAGTHLSVLAEFVQPDADGRIDHDWATHQLLTCVDWSPNSSAAIVLTGGANAHSAHHLFPQVAHSHNKALNRIVDKVAGDHGIAHHVTTFPGMVRSHFALLSRLGQKAQPSDGSASSA